MMENAQVDMNEFMDKLDGGKFKKENLPNTGEKFTKEYVEQQVKSYSEFMSGGALDEIRKL